MISFSTALSGFLKVGHESAESLTDARLQLHWASQIVSAVGATLLPAVDDDSHTALEWRADSRLLTGNLVPGDRPFRAALHPVNFTLHLLDADDRELASTPLEDREYDQGIAWLARVIEAHVGRHLAAPLQRRDYNLPKHPISSGEPFAPLLGKLAELARWYDNANRFLSEIVEQLPGALPVRCWPHHFDIATVIQIDSDPDIPAESARVIGVGLSPGDDNYPEPYWYVNPHPSPIDATLPPISGGAHWHTVDWMGAVLRSSKLTAAGNSADQANNTAHFLTSAVQACFSLLGDTRRIN